MSDFVEWNPKRHGQRPPYWTPDTPTGLDNKNFVRQPNWAWIAGTLYYVPYEAVYGVPRPAPVDVGADLTETIHANTIEELRAANERWAIAFNQAEERANERIEALQADNAKLREKLELIALGMTIELDEEDGPIQVWMDAEELSAIARKALQETER